MQKLETIQKGFNGAASGGKKVSLADLIVLGGAAAVEKAAADAGFPVQVKVSTGRGDATQEQTDVTSFDYLRPRMDGFRNYLGKGSAMPAEFVLVDRANLLGLSAPEMTVLVGGLRVLGANHGDSSHGVFTDRVGVLSNDFFVNLLDLDTQWQATDESQEAFEGITASGAMWTGTRNDLVFGSNSELRAVAEVYGSDDAGQKFAEDFAAAWAKVMDADRFDLR
jgi:catalase-peroxidase